MQRRSRRKKLTWAKFVKKVRTKDYRSLVKLLGVKRAAGAWRDIGWDKLVQRLGAKKALRYRLRRRRKNPLPRWVDRRSIRTIIRGKRRLLIGCSKGSWSQRRRRCRKGTRLVEKKGFNMTARQKKWRKLVKKYGVRGAAKRYRGKRVSRKHAKRSRRGGAGRRLKGLKRGRWLFKHASPAMRRSWAKKAAKTRALRKCLASRAGVSMPPAVGTNPFASSRAWPKRTAGYRSGLPIRSSITPLGSQATATRWPVFAGSKSRYGLKSRRSLAAEDLYGLNPMIPCCANPMFE